MSASDSSASLNEKIAALVAVTPHASIVSPPQRKCVGCKTTEGFLVTIKTDGETYCRACLPRPKADGKEEYTPPGPTVRFFAK